MARDCNVYVSGLPDGTDGEGLRHLFEDCGPIVAVRVGPSTQGERSSAFVNFESPSSARAAANRMKSFNYKGVHVQVQLAGFVHAWGDVTAASDATFHAQRNALGDARLVGHLQFWTGQYGWIQPILEIDHPMAAKRAGRVYVAAQDVNGREILQVGDKVSFKLYVDPEGLGAAEVRLEQPVGGSEGKASPMESSRRDLGSPSTASVYICNWPTSLDSAALHQAFENVAPVKEARVCRAKQPLCRSNGRVDFLSAEAAKAAVDAMDGAMYGDVPLRVMLMSDDKGASTGAGRISIAREGRMFKQPCLDDRFTGSVRSWKGKHGWIASDVCVCHPAALQHEGLVFVDADDIEALSELQVGDRVSFAAYADNHGIGAADVRLEGVDKAPGPTKWWHELGSTTCPISQKPVSGLDYEPFGLADGGKGSGTEVCEGLWGAAAVAAFLSMQSVLWFDGLYLACFFVCQGKAVAPVSHVSLSKMVCGSLDDYLAANRLPAVRVTDALNCQDVPGVHKVQTEGEAPSFQQCAQNRLQALRGIGVAEDVLSVVSQACHTAQSVRVAADDSEHCRFAQVSSNGRRRRWGRDRPTMADNMVIERRAAAS